MPDFFQSVRRGGHEAVLVFTELSDVNIRNDEGATLLHTAIAYSNVDAAIELIHRGIGANAQDRRGQTPLHYAGAYNNAIVAEQILSHGGSFEITDEHGNTALWTAVFNARGKYDIVKLLIERGAASVAQHKNKHGRSPIDFALQIGDSSLLKLLSNDS